MRRVLGRVLGWVARVWLLTLRLQVHTHPALSALEGRVPWVLCFWHGTQWPLLAWKRRRATAVLVSLSTDGEIQSGALSSLGFCIERGSSSRGGARGLMAIVRRIKRGTDAAFAVDGPRGPLHEVKPGAILAAARTQGVLVPMGAACARGHRFERAWDKYFLGWPFSRAVVVLGAPIEPVEGAGLVVAEAIQRANEHAQALLSSEAKLVRANA